MSFSTTYDEYEITNEAARYLPDTVFKYHNFNYKSSQDQFERWLSEATHHTHSNPHLNFLPILSEKFVHEGGVIPDDQIRNLQKCLRGRQICYYHLLSKGNADDGHLYTIATLIEVIRIFKPETSEDYITRCTPVNLRALVQEHGSEKARELYLSPRPSNSTNKHAKVSRNNSNSDSSTHSEREQKLYHMSQKSWRHSSDSSSDASLTRCPSQSSISTAKSLSSTSSLDSQKRWRSTSPRPVAATTSYQAVPAATPSEWQTKTEARASSMPPISPRKKLVLMTRAARSRSAQR